VNIPIKAGLFTMQYSQITVQLNEESHNIHTTKTFMSYAGEECSLPGFFIPEPFRLVKSVYCNEYRVLSKEPDPKTLFYIRLFDAPQSISPLFNKHPSLSKKLTQCLVWSSMIPNHRDAFHFLANKFFDYFLNEYNIAITIGPMTLCSAHFWEGRLLASFTRPDVSIYRSDGNSVIKIPNWLEFQMEWSEFIFKSSEDINDPSVILIAKDKP